jgi:hypothetical protein
LLAFAQCATAQKSVRDFCLPAHPHILFMSGEKVLVYKYFAKSI